MNGRRFLAALAFSLLPAYTRLGFAADPPQRQTFRLSYVLPSALVRSTAVMQYSDDDTELPHPLLPSGITRLDANDPAKVLTVYGDAAAIQRFLQLVRQIDVEPLRCRFHVRILRYHRADFSTRPIPEEVVIGTVEATNREPTALTLYGAGRRFTASLLMTLPQGKSGAQWGPALVSTVLRANLPVNGDALHDALRVWEDRENIMERVMLPERPFLCTGTTSTPDKNLRRIVRQASELLPPGAPPANRSGSQPQE